MSKLLRALGQIGRCGSIYRLGKLPIEDLPPFHHNLLIEICESPGLSQDRLARQMCLNKSTVTRRLTYLEDHGYVMRTPGTSDKRVLLVAPTEKALALLPDLQRLNEEWSEALTEELTDTELDNLLSTLERLSDRAKALASTVGGEEK